MRSGATGSLDAYHYGDNFPGLPTLSDKFMRETKENVKRSLAVQNQPQFIVDFYCQNYSTRPLPTFSVPGLMDHL